MWYGSTYHDRHHSMNSIVLDILCWGPWAAPVRGPGQAQRVPHPRQTGPGRPALLKLGCINSQWTQMSVWCLFLIAYTRYQLQWDLQSIHHSLFPLLLIKCTEVFVDKIYNLYHCFEFAFKIVKQYEKKRKRMMTNVWLTHTKTRTQCRATVAATCRGEPKSTPSRSTRSSFTSR